MQKHTEVNARKEVMGGLEKISENLELAESKKNSIKQSILSLLVQWRDFEGQLEATQKDFDEGFRELDSRGKKLNSEQEALELTRESVEQRFKEVGDREKDFALFRQKKVRDLELKEKELINIRDNYVKESEERLSEQEKRVQGLLATLESEKLQMERLKNFVEKRFKEIGFEEKSLEDKRKEIDLIQNSIEKRTSELEHNEGKIKERERRIELEEEELNLRKERQIEVELKEKELQLMIEDLQLKEKELDFIRQLNEKRMKELDLKEKQSEMNFEQDFHSKEKGKELLEKGLKHLELQRKEFEEQVKELELREKRLQESIKEFQLENKDFLLEKKLLEKESKDLQEKEKEFENRIKQFEFREKELKNKESMLGFLEKESKDLESKWREFDHRIKELDARGKVLEESFQEFHVNEKQFQLEKELLEKESKHLESEREELEERIKNFELKEKELELKEKQLNSVPHAHVKNEPVQGVVGQSLLCNSSDAEIRFVPMMDGKDLQIFLNEREKDHHLMGDQVFKALQLSKDPAKQVLDAMEGFFPPRLRKGDREFTGYVVRRSCMLLLRQLIRMSPQVQPCVRDEALELARKWKTRLTSGSPLEVFSFLYLLASYDVASAFDAEDIMRSLEFVSHHQQKVEPELCRHLGLREKIPSLIENLLKSNQSLEAIRIIYGFELVDCFPPVPILKNYLKHVKIYANMLRKRCNTQNAQNESIDTRVAAMRSVIRCIFDHKLESQCSPMGLENTIKQLLMQKRDKKFTGPSNCRKAQGVQKVEVKQISSTTAPSHPKAHRLAPDLSNTFTGHSHPLAVIIANMDGKNLLSFLSLHLVEHKSLQNEVLTALRISDDSSKLVLDAVENLYDSHQTEEEAKSCIFLLEQLIGLFPHITPDVKEAAQKIAFDWQAKLKAKNGNHLLILMFLLLVSTYGLASTFHSDELLNLYQTVAEHKLAPELSQALGISKDDSSAAAFHSQVESQKATSKSLSANLADGESLCTGMDLEGEPCVSVCSEIPTYINHSSDPADLILDALRNCQRSNFSKNENRQLIFKSFLCLLEQLKSVSLQIKPNVRCQALEFALDWKAKSIWTNSWEALGFLQLVATYELSSFFSSDQLFGLLEVVSQPKKAGKLVRILGLDNIPGFISQLIKKKKLLLAFDYVYDFKLMDMFPPVALLKQYVRNSKIVAKKICYKGQKTPEAQDKAIVSEISALKAVIKLITQHHLQSEYSPVELRATIEQLESQRANLKTSMQILDAKKEVSLAPKAQMQQGDNKKRPACDATFINEACLEPANKFPRIVSPSQFTDGHPIRSVQPSSQHPGDLNSEPYALSSRAPSRHYSFDGLPLTVPPQNQFPLPSNHYAMAYNYIPPLRMAGEHAFQRVWRHPSHPDFQRTN